MRVRTTDQLADMWTKGSCTVSQWQVLLQQWQLEKLKNVGVIRSTSLKTASCAAVALLQNMACAMTEEAATIKDG